MFAACFVSNAKFDEEKIKYFIESQKRYVSFGVVKKRHHLVPFL